MKTTINKTPTGPPLPFPKLMTADGNKIVLFDQEEHGVVIHQGDNRRQGADRHQVGFYSALWYMPAFTDFHGTVTLENNPVGDYLENEDGYPFGQVNGERA